MTIVSLFIFAIGAYLVEEEIQLRQEITTNEKYLYD